MDKFGYVMDKYKTRAQLNGITEFPYQEWDDVNLVYEEYESGGWYEYQYNDDDKMVYRINNNGIWSRFWYYEDGETTIHCSGLIEEVFYHSNGEFTILDTQLPDGWLEHRYSDGLKMIGAEDSYGDMLHDEYP